MIVPPIAVPALLRRFWPAIPIVALAILCAVLWVRVADRDRTIANERAAWTADLARGDRERAAAELRFADRLTTGLAGYAATLAARQPIFVRSTNTVREYAQTPAGRTLCRGADRVRAIDDLDAEIAATARSAGGGARAVPTDPTAPPAGR